MQTKKISVQFGNIVMLWEFKKELRLNNCVMDADKLILTFECDNTPAIEETLSKYHGQLVSSRETA